MQKIQATSDLWVYCAKEIDVDAVIDTKSVPKYESYDEMIAIEKLQNDKNSKGECKKE